MVVSRCGSRSHPLTRLHAEIRGNRNPAPIIRSLCALNSWIALDDESGTARNLNDVIPKQWLAFLGYHASKRLPAPGGDRVTFLDA